MLKTLKLSFNHYLFLLTPQRSLPSVLALCYSRDARVVLFCVILDSPYSVSLQIGDYWLYLAHPYSGFHICEGLDYLPSVPHAFHQISPVVEGTWITEVDIYS